MPDRSGDRLKPLNTVSFSYIAVQNQGLWEKLLELL
jgi:hypothetical protein